MAACKSGRNLLSLVCVLVISSGSVESLNWTAQPLNPVETTERQEASLTWNYTLTANEQRDSQTFFKVTWKKFNLGTSFFGDFASYVKFTGSSPAFTEPNSPRIVVDRSTGTSSASLEFKDVKREDEGLYKIEVSVTFPGTATIAAQEFNLTVAVPPRIANVSNYQVVCEGSLVTLSCNATGIPPPDITWTRVEDDGTDSEPLETSGKYVLSNIQRSANGTYRCTAHNAVGVPVNRTVSVKVEYSPAVERIVISSNSVNEDQSFNMTCETSGYPEPNVYWIKENNGARINGSVLTFTNINRNDSGQYRCEASNACGSNSSVQSIEVFYPPTKGPYSAIVRVIEGTQVTLSCPVDGRPEPNITWYKGNDTTAEAQHQGREWTFPAESNGAGWYNCSAKNFLNLFEPVNVSFQLIVDKETTASPTNPSSVDTERIMKITLEIKDRDCNNFTEVLQERVRNETFRWLEPFGITDVKMNTMKTRSGSVKVDLELSFTQSVTVDKVVETLKNVANQSDFGGCYVDPKSIGETGKAVRATGVPTSATTVPLCQESFIKKANCSVNVVIVAVIAVMAVFLVAFVAGVIGWWIHKRRKCRKDPRIHHSESEVLHDQNDIEDGAYARVNGGYADSGPPSANGTAQPKEAGSNNTDVPAEQAAAAPPAYAVVDKSKKKDKDKKNIPDYAVVDKSKKKKKKPDVEDPYAEVEDPKKDKDHKTADPSTHDYAMVDKSKKKKRETDENAYATVDKSKKSKKGQQKPKAPGEVLYADLGDFQPVQPLPTVSTSPEPLAPLKRPTPYQGTEYADITQFLKGNATLPEGQSTEMQPTYANAGGGQGAAANKENANTGGEGDIEPKETPM